MVAHGILFIVLPLAVAWFAGVTAYLPPYSLPAPKTEPVEPEFEAEVRTFLAKHSEPDAVGDRRMVGAASWNTPTIVRNLADCMRIEGNVAGALPLSRSALGQGASRHAHQRQHSSRSRRRSGMAVMMTGLSGSVDRFG